MFRSIRRSSFHMDSSCFNSQRKLETLECVVPVPLGRSNEAIPEDATSNIIFPCERNVLIIVFQRKVFPVPPWSYTNISYC
ncbi:hypothetical protein Tco_0735779 [Tanacetum coccineum]